MLSAQFVVIYGGANWLSHQRTDVHHIYFDWELGIPLVEPMAWVYVLIVPLMLLPLFYLDIRQLTNLAKQMALAMLIAGVVFVVFPGTTGYEPSANPSRAIQFIRWIDLPYNVFPSLHVALSSIVTLHLSRIFGVCGQAFLFVWMVALIASVILTHQHHLADVLGAALLVWFCQRSLLQNASVS